MKTQRLICIAIVLCLATAPLAFGQDFPTPESPVDSDAESSGNVLELIALLIFWIFKLGFGALGLGALVYAGKAIVVGLYQWMQDRQDVGEVMGKSTGAVVLGIIVTVIAGFGIAGIEAVQNIVLGG